MLEVENPMANGKPHDNPITDLLIHGRHPFPADLEALVIELHKRDSAVFNELGWAPFDWEEGKYLDQARSLLAALIQTHGNPIARRKHIEAHRANTK